MTELTTRMKVRWASRSLAFLLWVGIRRPALLWHYVKDVVEYLLVKTGVRARVARDVHAVRAEFRSYAVRGQFKELFFDMNDSIIVYWCGTFSKFFRRSDPIRILEIGSWEGRSSLFFLTYFTQAHLTAVDTWAGSDEYHYNATSDLSDLERRFDGNLAPHGDRLTKRKGSSLFVLPQLLDEQQEFDLIYVDGSHAADDVLMDGITSWRMLAQGGVLIFDDFLWCMYPRAKANPAWAISAFLKYHTGEYEILNVYSQLVLRKTVSFTDRVTTELDGVQFDRREAV